MCINSVHKGIVNKLHKMMISCEEAGVLANKREVTKLSFKERFNLMIHTAGCKVCRIAQKQLKILSECIQKGSDNIEIGIYTDHLTESYKAEMQKLINSKLSAR